MVNLEQSWIVNGHIYASGTPVDTIPKDDAKLLAERKAFDPAELPEFGTVSLDDQEREAAERRGVVDRPPSQLPGAYIQGEVPDQGGLASPEQTPPAGRNRAPRPAPTPAPTVEGEGSGS